MTLLQPGDQFPTIVVPRAGGGELRLPDAVAGQFGVVLFNRGSWCPYCNAQLAAFQRALPRLTDVGATVVSLSADDEDAAQSVIAKHGLAFPVGYGADPATVAAATGAFVNKDPAFLQSTGFVLDPTGRVVVSVYSSGAIGRLTADDVVGLITYLQSHQS